MAEGSIIKLVKAREVYSERQHPGVETTVVTNNGAVGVAVATAGVSIGIHEVQFVYDGGERWGGKGVKKAAQNIKDIIAPTIVGKDATKQGEIDSIMLELDGTPNKAKLGGNTTASVSAAVLKAGAASLNIPLYQHIGGVNAVTLPTPGAGAFLGSNRYGGGQRSGGKPSVDFQAYGYSSFAEASYALYEVTREFERLCLNKFGLKPMVIGRRFFIIGPGIVSSDRELWDTMVEAIHNSGHEGKVGIQIDVAAGTYYEKEKDKFVGLFSSEDKTKEDLIEYYKQMVRDYPLVVLEDPLDEEDYEGHALLTRELGIQVVGDDLFTTNVARLKKGLEVGAGNTVLLKVNQIGTISEAFETVRLAYRKGYGVMPCSSRGEGIDIADYAVGLSTGTIRESGLDQTTNRLLEIEEELGDKATFLGKDGFKCGPAK